MNNVFTIDCFPQSAHLYREGWAVVAVDVIRATTMAITAASLGRRCYPVDSVDAALNLARQLDDPLLAGELDGDMPPGFEMQNSPAALAERTDVCRPLIMLSSSGTRLIANANRCDALYLACFRNCASLARHLCLGAHSQIALIGAGSRGEFREEDQIGCAWIGMQLIRNGFIPQDDKTAEVVDRWGEARPTACLFSRSIDYLRRTGQMADLDFILEKIDDLDDVFMLIKDQVMAVPQEQPAWDTAGVAVSR